MGSVFSCFNKVASNQSDQQLEEEPSDTSPQGSRNSSEVSVSSAVTEEDLIEDSALEELCEVAGFELEDFSMMSSSERVNLALKLHQTKEFQNYLCDQADDVVDDLAGDITDHLGKRNEKILTQKALPKSTYSGHSSTYNQSVLREGVGGYRVKTSETHPPSPIVRNPAKRCTVSEKTRAKLTNMLESMLDVREKSRRKRLSEWSRSASKRLPKLQNTSSSRKNHKLSPAINNSSRSA